jgi:hypothetical protein
MKDSKVNTILVLVVIMFILQVLGFLGVKPQPLSSSAAMNCDDAYVVYRGAQISGDTSRASRTLRGATASGCDTASW